MEQEQLKIGIFAQAALLAHTGTATAMATMNVPNTTFVGKTTAGTSGLRLRRLPTAASQVGLGCFGFVLAVFSFALSEVKLVGGSGPHEGNIFVGGKPVCDDDHDVENALVVCRYLVVFEISREISKISSSSMMIHHVKKLKLSKILQLTISDTAILNQGF